MITSENKLQWKLLPCLLFVVLTPIDAHKDKVPSQRLVHFPASDSEPLLDAGRRCSCGGTCEHGLRLCRHSAQHIRAVRRQQTINLCITNHIQLPRSSFRVAVICRIWAIFTLQTYCWFHRGFISAVSLVKNNILQTRSMKQWLILPWINTCN